MDSGTYMKLSDKHLFRCSESLSLHKYLIKLKTCFFLPSSVVVQLFFNFRALFLLSFHFRPLVEASLIKLWRELFTHLLNVVKNNVMNPEEVGDTFGSLLIPQSSKYWREVGLYFVFLLQKLKVNLKWLNGRAV